MMDCCGVITGKAESLMPFTATRNQLGRTGDEAQKDVELKSDRIHRPERRVELELLRCLFRAVELTEDDVIV